MYQYIPPTPHCPSLPHTTTLPPRVPVPVIFFWVLRPSVQKENERLALFLTCIFKVSPTDALNTGPRSPCCDVTGFLVENDWSVYSRQTAFLNTASLKQIQMCVKAYIKYLCMQYTCKYSTAWALPHYEEILNHVLHFLTIQQIFLVKLQLNQPLEIELHSEN